MLLSLYKVSFILGSGVMFSRGTPLNISWHVLRGNVLPVAPVFTLSLALHCTPGESCITSRVLKASFCTIECTSVLDICIVSNISTSDISSVDKCILWFCVSLYFDRRLFCG